MGDFDLSEEELFKRPIRNPGGWIGTWFPLGIPLCSEKGVQFKPSTSSELTRYSNRRLQVPQPRSWAKPNRQHSSGLVKASLLFLPQTQELRSFTSLRTWGVSCQRSTRERYCISEKALHAEANKLPYGTLKRRSLHWMICGIRPLSVLGPRGWIVLIPDQQALWNLPVIFLPSTPNYSCPPDCLIKSMLMVGWL